MKLSGFLAIALVCAACSDKPAPEQTPSPALQPESNATATGGEEPAAEVTPNRPVESAAVKDARAAETGPVTVAAQQAGVNSDGAIVADFNARVKKYLDIHKAAAKGDAKLKQTEHPEEITAAQEALAAKIRAARADAKPGDIFTAEIR